MILIYAVDLINPWVMDARIQSNAWKLQQYRVIICNVDVSGCGAKKVMHEAWRKGVLCEWV